MTSGNLLKPKKLKRKRLHVYPRNLLTISGILQVCLLQVHIAAIVRLYNVIIGCYLLAFILFSTINILNGFGFATRPSLTAIVGTIFVTLCQMLFGILYISMVITETKLFTSEITLPVMIFSVIFFILGMLSTIIAMYFEIKVFRHADDIYQYMM